MNLFRSEEDARRWTEFVPGSEAGIVTLEQAMAIMSTPRATATASADTTSRRRPATAPRSSRGSAR